MYVPQDSIWRRILKSFESWCKRSRKRVVVRSKLHSLYQGLHLHVLPLEQGNKKSKEACRCRPAREIFPDPWIPVPNAGLSAPSTSSTSAEERRRTTTPRFRFPSTARSHRHPLGWPGRPRRARGSPQHTQPGGAFPPPTGARLQRRRLGYWWESGSGIHPVPPPAGPRRVAARTSESHQPPPPWRLARPAGAGTGSLHPKFPSHPPSRRFSTLLCSAAAAVGRSTVKTSPLRRLLETQILAYCCSCSCSCSVGALVNYCQIPLRRFLETPIFVA